MTLSLAGLLQILTASQSRLARVYEKWRETHILMQAAEYYLLQPGEDPGGVPYTYFPYSDYEALCYYRDAENLPEDYINIPDQLPLRTCVVELIRLRDRKTVGKQPSCNRLFFVLQKTTYYDAKGRLSQRKRRPFGTENVTYWRSTDCVRVYGAQYFFLVYAERIIHQLLRPDAVFRHIV